MRCSQPNVAIPVDFEGESLNIMIDATGKKAWVCIDGESVFRGRVTKPVTIDDHRDTFGYLDEEKK